MIWADKMALRVMLFIVAAAFFVWVLAIIALGSAFDGSLNANMLLWTAEAELAVVLPLWLGLRAVDLLMAGPWRRRAVRSGEPGEIPRVKRECWKIRQI